VRGPAALAFFDVEGVVLDTTSRTSTRGCARATCPSSTGSCGAPAAGAVPGWLQADRRSRAAFNRRFYRLYRDLPARELRAQAAEALPDFIQPRDPARGGAPDPRAPPPRRPRDADDRRAGLPRRLAAPPRRRAVAARLVERTGASPASSPSRR
jgi:hypothetical protein